MAEEKGKTGISVTEYNKEITASLNQAKMKIENLSKSSSNGSLINGVWIDNQYLFEYRNLVDLLGMLNFNVKLCNEKTESKVLLFVASDNKLNRDGFAIKGVALPRNVYPRFFSILNKTKNVAYPKDFEMAGMLPNTSIPVPRLMVYSEPIEHYEEYLKNYYANYGLVAGNDKKGIRRPYIHEEYEWVKGRPVARQGYLSPYYQMMYEKKLQELGQSRGETYNRYTRPVPEEDEYEEEIDKPSLKEQIQAGLEKLTRPKAGKGRYRVKKKTPMNEFFTKIKEKVNEKTGLPVDSPVWKHVRRTAIVVGILTLAPVLGGAFALLVPLFTSLLETLGAVSGMILPSLTGAGHNRAGVAYTKTDIEVMRRGILSLIKLCGFGVVAVLLAKWRLKKAKQAKEDVKSKGEEKEKKEKEPSFNKEEKQDDYEEQTYYENETEELLAYYKKTLKYNRACMMRLLSEDPALEDPKNKKRYRELLEERQQIVSELTDLQKGKEKGRGK